MAVTKYMHCIKTALVSIWRPSSARARTSAPHGLTSAIALVTFTLTTISLRPRSDLMSMPSADSDAAYYSSALHQIQERPPVIPSKFLPPDLQNVQKRQVEDVCVLIMRAT